jgi:hypothetical protein
MDKSDKQFFAQIAIGTLASMAVWWYFTGRRKYSTKGMTRSG